MKSSSPLSIMAVGLQKKTYHMYSNVFTSNNHAAMSQLARDSDWPSSNRLSITIKVGLRLKVRLVSERHSLYLYLYNTFLMLNSKIATLHKVLQNIVNIKISALERYFLSAYLYSL